MIIRARSALLALSAATLVACGHPTTSSVSLHNGGLSLRDGQVVIDGPGGSQARISSTGQLVIGGHEVAVSGAQRAELVRYHSAASAVVSHAVATGAAGAAVGVAAVTSVASGLAKGDMSEVKAKVETQADELKRQALKMCDDLTAMRAAQDALSAGLEAFRPYAVVSARDAADCARDLRSAQP
jgi:hypothetical protein